MIGHADDQRPEEAEGLEMGMEPDGLGDRPAAPVEPREHPGPERRPDHERGQQGDQPERPIDGRLADSRSRADGIDVNSGVLPARLARNLERIQPRNREREHCRRHDRRAVPTRKRPRVRVAAPHHRHATSRKIWAPALQSIRREPCARRLAMKIGARGSGASAALPSWLALAGSVCTSMRGPGASDDGTGGFRWS